MKIENKLSTASPKTNVYKSISKENFNAIQEHKSVEKEAC